MMEGRTWQVLAILFLATGIRSAFGFGEALVAVPLLSLLMPVSVAAPVAVLVSITVAGIAVAQDWRSVHVHSVWRLLLATLFGTPLGLLLLTAAPGGAVKGILAAVILTFSAYSLLRRRPPAGLADDRLAWLFGFGAGILGGAYGMNGPPLAVYGALRGWSPQAFRATLQGYFLPASVAGMCGYALLGLWTPAVTRYYVTALPAVVLAVFLGRMVNQRMTGRSFLRYVYAGLIGTGCVLLYQSLSGR